MRQKKQISPSAIVIATLAGFLPLLPQKMLSEEISHITTVIIAILILSIPFVISLTALWNLSRKDCPVCQHPQPPHWLSKIELLLLLSSVALALLAQHVSVQLINYAVITGTLAIYLIGISIFQRMHLLGGRGRLHAHGKRAQIIGLMLIFGMSLIASFTINLVT